jgi:hypothetical protein
MSDKNSKKNSKHRQIEERKQEKKPSLEKHDAIESNTGTIQKRKSNFKNIKPNSLKNSSEIDGMCQSGRTNLLLFFSHAPNWFSHYRNV